MLMQQDPAVCNTKELPWICFILPACQLCLAPGRDQSEALKKSNATADAHR